MRVPLIFFISVLMLTLGCSISTNKISAPSELARFTWSATSAESPTIQILNQYGEPVSQAKILVGQSQDLPFKRNFLTTDQAGQAVVPVDWKSPQHVTVDAAGYIRQTLLDQLPGDLIIKLNPAYLSVPAEIQGTVIGLPVVNGDKLIDFGLVMPAMTRADLLTFDLNSVISPYTDSFTVAGQQANVPSNISLPSQKENYIFPLTIAKPIYRMVSPTLGPKRLFALRGQFPFKTVIDEMRAGKKFYELLNYFSIQGGSLRDVILLGPTTYLDIPGGEISFKSTLHVQPAAFGADEVVVVVAVSDVANSLIPTDIKRATNSAAVSLSSLANRPAYVVHVMKKQSEFSSHAAGSDRISAALAPYNEMTKTDLLPLITSPTITISGGYTISTQVLPQKVGIYSLALSAALSDLTDIQSGGHTITSVNKRWEIFGLGWNDRVQLPDWPLANSNGKKRIEINFIGTTSPVAVPLSSVIDAATHVTHASTDF